MPRATKPDDYLDLDSMDFEEEGPSCTFKLAGRDWHCRPTGQISSWLIDELSAAAAQQTTSLVRISDFFRSALERDEIDDFLKVINNPESPLTQAHIAPLMQHVVSRMAQRPTGRPSSSGAGSRRTGRTSKASSSSRATKASTA